MSNSNNSKIKLGTRVKIINVRGEDSYLNNQTGILTNPFPSFGFRTEGMRGVFLDNNTCCNVYLNEFEVLESYQLNLLKK